MRALVFSDLHVNHKYLDDLVKYCIGHEEIDLLIFAGDFLNGGEPSSFASTFIEAIEKVNRPFFWVPGNNDFGRGYHKLNAKYPSLEGKVVVYKPAVISSENEKSHVREDSHAGSSSAKGGLALAQDDNSIRLTGVGGSPASWAGQYAGETMIDRKSIAGSIFISHVPPPGIMVMNKYDCEMPTDKKLSDAPLIHICGHQHSRWGCGYLGRTKVINPGPLEWGRYVIINLENLKVEFKKFV